MPGKKPPPGKPPAASGPAWQILLEEMRSQNRTTIEAVESVRSELKRDIAEFRGETNARFQVLESAVRENGADILVLQGDVRNLAEKVAENSADIRQNSADIRQNSADIRQNTADIRQNTADIRQNSADIRQNSVDIRRLDGTVAELTEKVDTFTGLEARVSALERRTG